MRGKHSSPLPPEEEENNSLKIHFFLALSALAPLSVEDRRLHTPAPTVSYSASVSYIGGPAAHFRMRRHFVIVYFVLGLEAMKFWSSQPKLRQNVV